MLALAVGARVLGDAGFDAYPSVSMSAGLATVAVAVAMPMVAAAPFAAARFRSRIIGVARG
jgi:hypothetical protein